MEICPQAISKHKKHLSRKRIFVKVAVTDYVDKYLNKKNHTFSDKKYRYACSMEPEECSSEVLTKMLQKRTCIKPEKNKDICSINDFWLFSTVSF